jgi:hypothetical protein
VPALPAVPGTLTAKVRADPPMGGLTRPGAG